MALKDQIIARTTTLQTLRGVLVAKQQAQLTNLDGQIAACQQLVATWDTLTIDQAVPLLRQAGVKVAIDP